MTIISEVCSKIAILLTILVCMIFVLRIIGKRVNRKHWIHKWNRNLRKKHISLAITLIIVAVLHGVFSYIGIFRLTWGLVCIVLLIILGITYLKRKKLKRKWIFFHRLMVIAFLFSLIVHVSIEVDTFKEEHHQNTNHHRKFHRQK